MQKLRISPYKLFDNFDEAYKLAAIENVGSTKKRKIKKRKLVMEFIMQNQTATQREINRNCKTKVQELFKQGIFGAYKESGIEFPFKRLKIHGAAIKEVKQRAKDFEGEIARKLSCYGNINRLIKTKRGVADIILERGDKKIIIEVKDYLNKEICQHEIKQLYKYLQDCECGLGLIICHTKPRKDRFIINRNKILILESNELNKIPEILDKE